MINLTLENITKEYSTHNLVLIRIVEISTGPVLEVGAGLFSTPLLHWLCKLHNRRLYTLENNDDFFYWARQFRSPGHSIVQVTKVADFKVKKHWGVVFVDHDMVDSLRSDDAISFKDSADYVVFHDSDERVYGFKKVKPYFKHVYEWTGCRPQTAILSNFKELDNLCL